MVSPYVQQLCIIVIPMLYRTALYHNSYISRTVFLVIISFTFLSLIYTYVLTESRDNTLVDTDEF